MLIDRLRFTIITAKEEFARAGRNARQEEGGSVRACETKLGCAGVVHLSGGWGGCVCVCVRVRV